MDATTAIQSPPDIIQSDVRPPVDDLAAMWRQIGEDVDVEAADPMVRGARRVRLGRNLITISPYKGLDPEVSNFGNQAIARNIDVAPFPPSRSFFFSIDLGF
jgi:hypothetical protein